MLPADATRAYNFAILSRILLWQHVGDLCPLGGITKEKRILELELGTLSWYARSLATRPPPPLPNRSSHIQHLSYSLPFPSTYVFLIYVLVNFKFIMNNLYTIKHISMHMFVLHCKLRIFTNFHIQKGWYSVSQS